MLTANRWEPVIPAGDVRLSDGRVLRRHPAMGPIERFVQSEDNTGLTVLASIDDTPRFGKLLHVSVSYRDTDPQWADLKAVRAAFFPGGVDVVMVLPRAADYINIHQHCFHLWQAPTAWDMR